MGLMPYFWFFRFVLVLSRYIIIGISICMWVLRSACHTCLCTIGRTLLPLWFGVIPAKWVDVWVNKISKFKTKSSVSVLALSWIRPPLHRSTKDSRRKGSWMSLEIGWENVYLNWNIASWHWLARNDKNTRKGVQVRRPLPRSTEHPFTQNRTDCETEARNCQWDLNKELDANCSLCSDDTNREQHLRTRSLDRAFLAHDKQLRHFRAFAANWSAQETGEFILARRGKCQAATPCMGGLH